MEFIDSFQERIWKEKYQYENETFDEYCNRISNTIFPNEQKKRDKLFKLLNNFKTTFGGRINSNIGIQDNGLTLFNCFIATTEENPDSLNGILDLLKKYALTLKTEGGIGFCANFFRPKNTIIRKIGVSSPGPIKFLEIFDKASDVITSGSINKELSKQGIPFKNSIRKGATMVTMDIRHPDIKEFISAKSIPNRLTKMNMSVLVTDEFINALKNNESFELWFPDINFEHYEKEWDGDFVRWERKNYPKVVYENINAKELWNFLLTNCYNRNEPGIIFSDNIKRYNNLHYLNDSSFLSTNPCAEVFGITGKIKNEYMGDICCLGSLNLTQYYDKENKFYIDEFRDDVELMVEALDNVIECSNYPLKEYENAAKLKRKIGLGLMGVGSLCMMDNIEYGSEESIDKIEKILDVFINTAYQKSAILAKEKGTFPIYDKNEIFKDGYIKNGKLWDSTKKLIQENGLRNSALSAIAPNGSTSILMGNVSGGIEPVFAKEGIRWLRVQYDVDFEFPDTKNGEWFETDYLKEQEIFNDLMLLSTDGKYRVDKNNGLCEKIEFKDYGYNYLLENYDNDLNDKCSQELSIENHINILKLFSEYIDLNCSKTINLPNEIKFDEFKELYENIYESGIKGCTVYRDGTMVGILESDKNKKKKKVNKQHKKFLQHFKDHEDGKIKNNVKLPEEYLSKGYKLYSEGKKWYLHVAFKDEEMSKPFALFVNTNHREDNILTFNTLDKLEELCYSVGLDKNKTEDIKKKYASQKNAVRICRMLGYLLRHNVNIIDIVKKIDEVQEATPGTFVHRMKKFLSQFIENHDEVYICNECGEKSLIFQEGCFLCQNCGSSKC